MPILADALRCWQSDSFCSSLKSEIENLPGGSLPLDKATTRGGHVDDSDLSVTVIRTHDHGDFIQADIGVFFGEIIAGCSCGDDPFTENAYCELHVTLDKTSAEAEFDPVAG